MYHYGPVEDKDGRAMLKALDKIKKGDYESCFADFYDSQGLDMPEKDDELDYDKIKEDVIDTIKAFMECIGYRDVTYHHVGPLYIYQSGGVSYGDAPTDSYHSIDRLYNIPQNILTAGGFPEKIDTFELFLMDYGKKMPDKVKKILLAWRTANAI